MAGLPPEVKAMVEFRPVEDILLAVLRDAFPTVKVGSKIAKSQKFPFILARRDHFSGTWDGDERFVDFARIKIDTFCEDPDGDEDAALLAEAVRVAIRDAARRPKVYPGLGHITYSEMITAPRRSPDWATSSGPVQYADLPEGVWRYETEFDVEIRKPRTNPVPLPKETP